MKTGTLYIVASPIGNMEDITLRAIKILKGSGLILSEDTRVTKKLLSRHNISSPVVSCHKFNEKSRARHLTKTLASGRDVSLVSDAGTPLLSDPGFFIVSECIREGIKVSPVPGPSSVTAAAVVSGFDPAKFVFRGFLPRKKKELREELEAAEKSSVPVIFFEAPSRVLKTLEAAAGIFAKTREVAVIKELTKIHEEVYRGGPEFLTEKLKGGRPRGEFIIVVSGRKEKKEEPADEEIKAELGALIKKGEKKSRAARRVAEKMGINKNRVYDISIGKKGHGSKKKIKGGVKMETAKLKVSGKSNPKSVAGSIANNIREKKQVEIMVMGPNAVNQAVKAVAIAGEYVAEENIEMLCKPSFAHLELEGEQKSAMKLEIITSEK